MRKKYLAVMSTVLLTSVMLVGCANPFAMTTEKALDKMAKYIDSAGSVEMTMDFKTSLGTTIEGTNASIDIKGDLDMDSVYDNKSKESTTALDGNLGLSIFGMDVSQDIKSYTVNDGEKTTTYSYNTNDKSWTKSVEDQDKESTLLSDLTKCNFAKDTENLVLEKSTYEDKDCYKISGTANDVDLSKENAEEFEEFIKNGAEINPVDVEIELYMDKKTFAPISLKMSTEDELLSYHDEASSQTLYIKGLELEMKIDQFGGLKEVEIDKDALDAEEKDASLSDSFLGNLTGDESGDSEQDDTNTDTDDFNTDDFNTDDFNTDDTDNAMNLDDSGSEFNAYNLKEIDESEQKVTYSDGDFYAENSKPISCKYLVADNGVAIEVENNESDTISVSAVVRFFDEDYNEVDYMVDGIDAIAKESTGHANVYSITNKPCKYYSVSTYCDTADSEAADLSTSDSEIDTDERTISCTVKNNSSKDSKYVKVFMYLYKDGDPVWFNVSYIEDDILGAGKETKFSYYSPDGINFDSVEFFAQGTVE